MSTIRTTLPIPTQPWQAAKSRFLNGLSPEDTRRFKDATLENLFYDASAAQKKHALNCKSWLLQERLSSLVDAVDEYGKALDVFSNIYGLILCPIWGGLRVILHIAGQAGKFQEELVGMLAQIGDVLPRFLIYQKLFGKHERLLHALSNAYLDILKFCVFTKDFFLHAKRSMIPWSIVLKGAWKPFRKEFEEYMAAFRKHRKTVEKEITLAHMIESARRGEMERANRALQVKNTKIAKRHRILSTLPAINYVNKHSQRVELRHSGTTAWLQATPQYGSWFSSLASACFYCYGIPGSGKSILSASLVDSLLRAGAMSKSSLVCYYYCDYTDMASLEPMAMVASLLQQVVQILPLDRFDEKFLSLFDHGPCLPAASECMQCFVEVLKEFKTAYIVIDGIDELAPEVQVFALNLIAHLLRPAPVVTKIFVTSRIGEYTIHRSLKNHTSLQITKELIDKDISLFISEKIEDIIAHKNPLLNKRGLKQDIIDALVDGANGMFLWVTFQLFDISEALTESEIRHCLQNLPRDLSETYSRILEKARNAPGGKAKVDKMQKVFLWVTGARRPLRIDELEEAVGLDKSDTFLRSDHAASGAGERLISCCCNLVVLNEEDGTVTFVHQTVRQYLCSSRVSLEPGSYQPNSIVSLDFSTADSYIGDICLAYLEFTDFDTQVARIQETTNIDKSRIEQLVWASVPLSAPIRRLVSWTQGRRGMSQAKPESQISFAMPVVTKPSDTLVQKYALLDYVITFWAFHTAHLRADSINWAKFKRVALNRQLAFEFRPWDKAEHRQRVETVLKNQDELRGLQRTEGRLRQSITKRSDWISQDMMIYSWALKHGVGSLLEFVNPSHLMVGSSVYRKSELEYFLKCASTSKPQIAGPTGFWHGPFVFHSLRKFNDEPPYYHAMGLTSLLYFFKEEFLCWVDQTETSADEMFRRAVILASQTEDRAVFRALVDLHVNSLEKLADIMGEILQNGHIREGVVETLLLCLNKEESLLQGLPQTEWQLLFVLWECFPVIESLLNEGGFFRSADWEIRQLIHIILLAKPRPDIIARHLQDLGNSSPLGSLSPPPADWSSLTFATVEACEALTKLVGKDLRQEAESILRAEKEKKNNFSKSDTA